MDNLGAVGGPLLALGLVAALGLRTSILVSIVPGLLAAVAIIYAIRRTPRPTGRTRQPIRFPVRPLLRGDLGRPLEPRPPLRWATSRPPFSSSEPPSF
jgi:MFS family permease